MTVIQGDTVTWAYNYKCASRASILANTTWSNKKSKLIFTLVRPAASGHATRPLPPDRPLTPTDLRDLPGEADRPADAVVAYEQRAQGPAPEVPEREHVHVRPEARHRHLRAVDRVLLHSDIRAATAATVSENDRNRHRTADRYEEEA